MQDARDIMSLQGPAPPAGPRPKKPKPIEKRPDGITRELYALLGDNTPPVAIVEKKFKEKPRWMGKATPWELKKFTNPARTDGLELQHWERKNPEAMEVDGEAAPSYPFARFNVKVEVPEYTDAEYEAALKDPEWSREETDYLFELCREYDLRWPVIWDRYEFQPASSTPAPPARSMETLKARYYGVCRHLLVHRHGPYPTLSPTLQQQHDTLLFDAAAETARKAQAERLFHRSADEIAEEEFLLTELRRIVAQQDAMRAARADLFRRLDMPQSAGSIAAYSGSAGLNLLREMMAHAGEKGKSAKRKSLASAPTPATPVETSAPATPPAAGPPKQKRKLTEDEREMYGVSYHEKLQAGIKFRSHMVGSYPRGVTQSRALSAFAQLGVSGKVAMPTARTVEKFEELQRSLVDLLDTKKHLEKLEQELRVLRAQAAKEE